MTTPLGISPAVMINRKAHEAAPLAANLAKVAQLRQQVLMAQQAEAERAAMLDPSGEAEPLPLSSGAVVDRLI